MPFALHNEILKELIDFLDQNKIKNELVTDSRLKDLDILLPDGFGKVHLDDKNTETINQPTGIELKGRLLFDTAQRYYHAFKRLQIERGIKYFFLVYIRLGVEEKALKRLKPFQKDNFYVLSVEQFKRLSAQPDAPKDTVHSREEAVYDWKLEREEKLAQAHDTFMNGNITLFLGAGVSMDAGLPSWNQLLANMLPTEEPCKQTITNKDVCDISQACGNSSIISGRFVRLLLGKKPGEKDFTQKIQQSLYANARPENSKLIAAICKLVRTKNVESIITYNFDDIMERMLAKEHIACYPVYGQNIPQAKLPICHVHGYIPSENDQDVPLLPIPVLSEEEYHKLYANPYSWSNVEQLHALNRTTCFFIGLSLTDPNLRRMLDTSFNRSEEHLRHFAFLRRYSDFKTECKDRQNLEIQQQIYNELGLNVIWFDKFEDLPGLLVKLI